MELMLLPAAPMPEAKNVLGPVLVESLPGLPGADFSASLKAGVLLVELEAGETGVEIAEVALARQFRVLRVQGQFAALPEPRPTSCWSSRSWSPA